jgi:hypothetical protein
MYVKRVLLHTPEVSKIWVDNNVYTNAMHMCLHDTSEN